MRLCRFHPHRNLAPRLWIRPARDARFQVVARAGPAARRIGRRSVPAVFARCLWTLAHHIRARCAEGRHNHPLRVTDKAYEHHRWAGAYVGEQHVLFPRDASEQRNGLKRTKPVEPYVPWVYERLAKGDALLELVLDRATPALRGLPGVVSP